MANKFIYTLVKANFPLLENLGEYKERPVLLLTEPLDKFKLCVAAYITSRIPSERLDSDYILENDNVIFANEEIQTSIIRMHRLAVLSPSAITETIGHLDSVSTHIIKQKLQVLFHLQN